MSVGPVTKGSRAAAAVLVSLLAAAGCGEPAPSGDGREEPGRNGMMGMMERMGPGMMDVEAPSTEERRLLRAYYARYALAEADSSTLSALEGRNAFLQACSRCHALPDPDTHRPGGVARCRPQDAGPHGTN